MAGIAKGNALGLDVWPRRSHARRGSGAKHLTRYKLKVCISALFWLAYLLLQCFQYLILCSGHFQFLFRAVFWRTTDESLEQKRILP